MAIHNLKYDPGTFQETFTEMCRLQSQGILCDLQIQTSTAHVFKVHKIVMVATCSYFQNLLSCSSLGSDVLISNIDYTTLANIIKFVYHQEICVQHCDLETLYQAALTLGISELVKKCTQGMGCTIKQENTISFYGNACSKDISLVDSYVHNNATTAIDTVPTTGNHAQEISNIIDSVDKDNRMRATTAKKSSLIDELFPESDADDCENQNDEDEDCDVKEHHNNQLNPLTMNSGIILNDKVVTGMLSGTPDLSEDYRDISFDFTSKEFLGNNLDKKRKMLEEDTIGVKNNQINPTVLCSSNKKRKKIDKDSEKLHIADNVHFDNNNKKQRTKVRREKRHKQDDEENQLNRSGGFDQVNKQNILTTKNTVKEEETDKLHLQDKIDPNNKRKMICSACQKSFFKTQYLVHKAREHNQGTKFSSEVSCPKCDVHFIFHELLIDHCKLEHNEKLFVCGYKQCDRIFSDSKQKQMHIAGVHCRSANNKKQRTKVRRREKRHKQDDEENNLNRTDGVGILNKKDISTTKNTVKEEETDKLHLQDKIDPNNKRKMICSTCEKSFFKTQYLVHKAREHNRGTKFSKEVSCPKCDVHFIFHELLIDHCKLEHYEKLFVCGYKQCDRIFSDSKQKQMHIADVHCRSANNKKQRTKVHRREKRHKQDDEENNLNRTDGVDVLNKKNILTTKNTVKEGETDKLHLQDKIDPNNKRKMICSACQKSFFKTQYLVHKAREHNQGTKFSKEVSCPKCDVHFIFHELLIDHCKLEHNEQLFFCRYKHCDRIFGDIKQKHMHIADVHKKKIVVKKKTHKKNESQMSSWGPVKIQVQNQFRPKVCEICGATYPRKLSLWLHEKSAHGIIHDEHYLKCEHCDYRAYGKTAIKVHIGFKHAEKTIPCDQCDRMFPTKTRLAYHIRYRHHKKTFLCQVCGQSFKYNDSLRVHERFCGMEKRYKCPDPECNYRCHRKVDMNSHVVSKHKIIPTDGKLKVCDTCGYQTTSNGSFKRHLLSHTRTTKTQKCPHCDSTFTTATNLRLHIKRHTGEKNEKCYLCNYASTEAAKLRDHIRMSHTMKGVKPFKCGYCSYCSALQGNMLKHVRSGHPDQDVIFEQIISLDTGVQLKPEKIRKFKFMSNLKRSVEITNT